MDSNHYCQTPHYNKQSPLSSGGEVGIWEEHKFIAERTLIYPADEGNRTNNTYSAERQDAVISFK